MAKLIDITVTPDVKKLERMLGPDLKKQARFALARATTACAYDARKELQGNLPQHFTIRNKWAAGSIQTTRASKADLEATVGSVTRAGSSFDLSIQAEGGERRARSGTLAVPVAARPTPESRTTKGKWPSKLLARKGYELRPLGKGFGVFRVYKRKPDKLFYVLTKTVRVRARWPFWAEVQAAVGRTWDKNIEDALDYAIKTAR